MKDFMTKKPTRDGLLSERNATEYRILNNLHHFLKENTKLEIRDYDSDDLYEKTNYVTFIIIFFHQYYNCYISIEDHAKIQLRFDSGVFPELEEKFEKINHILLADPNYKEKAMEILVDFGKKREEEIQKMKERMRKITFERTKNEGN